MERAKRLPGARLKGRNITGGCRLDCGRCGVDSDNRKRSGSLEMGRYRHSSDGGRGSGFGMGSHGCYTSLKGAIPQKAQIMELVLGF